MEVQTTASREPRVILTNTESGDTTTTPSPAEPLTASVLSLRFPRPQGSELIAKWVSNSSPDIRQPSDMSDTGSLAESAYEVIHGTDTESQDDRLTESTCSLSRSRPEDVHSLDGSTDHYNTDSEDEADQLSHASSIRYTDQALQNPSTQLPTISLENGSSTEGLGLAVRSIQLRESDVDDPYLAQSIFAKHVIREFSEEESAEIAENLALPNAPRHLLASIRQTMSQSYLFIQEPLRILYVGRAEARRAIVLKICSAIWASPLSKHQDDLHSYREGIYNIVPISSFGPEPELDLMEASRFQIKVEHCTSAEEVTYQEPQTPGDAAYSIVIEQEKAYLSIATTDGAIVEPKWDLPHIAIFYTCADDCKEDSATRHAAWSFMQRHGVPSIFIAEQQEFRDPSWGMYIDEHSVHLCLESRDPEKQMSPWRFPVDFASFTDIDARQLNRNLAYLTKLVEAEDNTGRSPARPTATLELQPEVRASLKKTRRSPRWSFDTLELARYFWSVFPALLLLAGPFFALSMVDWLRPGGLPRFHPSSSVGICVPSETYPGFTTSRSPTVTTSTKTVVINVTSTKTVQVGQTQSSTSTLASALSLAGFLSDKPSAVPADIEANNKKSSHSDKTMCSIRVYSPTEILLEIPSKNKAVWLAKGAIDIAVRRNNNLLRTRISSVDEGLLVGLEPKDANGALNITVITNRRPRINETFEVDFGKSTVAEVTQAIEAGLRMLRDALRDVPWIDDGKQLLQDARKLGKEFTSAFGQTSDTARRRTADAIGKAWVNAREQLDRQREAANIFREEFDLSILQAQIASRLWWLKIQGKVEEYTEYKRNASKFLRLRHQELAKGQGARTASPGEMKPYSCSRGGSYALWKSNCGKRDAADAASSQQDGAWEIPWRKLMGGS
ncbi:hypothetical protein L209DRAFT_751470 [Thermothelomyces heterothallicus CBS 203.75]